MSPSARFRGLEGGDWGIQREWGVNTYDDGVYPKSRGRAPAALLRLSA